MYGLVGFDVSFGNGDVSNKKQGGKSEETMCTQAKENLVGWPNYYFRRSRDPGDDDDEPEFCRFGKELISSGSSFLSSNDFRSRLCRILSEQTCLIDRLGISPGFRDNFSPAILCHSRRI